MKPTQSTAAFQRFAEASGISLADAAPSSGLAQALAFYGSKPAQGCGGESADMLLYQWGTYDWGEGEHFELDITRQFIEAGDSDDPSISQLSLTYSFQPTPALCSLGEGNAWCSSRAELEAFRSWVLTTPQLQAVAGEKPICVSLRHSYV